MTGAAQAGSPPGFKQTDIGIVPGDWEVLSLGDPEVSSVIMGQSPPSSTYNVEMRGVPFFQGAAEFGPRHPFPRLHCTSPSRMARKNDILLSVRAPVGDVNIAAEDCSIGRGVSAIRPADDDPRFLYYYLRSIHSRWVTERTTFEAVKKQDLTERLIPWPGKGERSKIGEALEIVDETIETTSAIVERARLVKTGLAHKLLTRGIGHKKFRRTEIGEIPEDWETATLKDVCERTIFSVPKSSDHFLYIDVSAVSSESLTISGAEYRDGATAPSRARKPVRGGDVILATVRPTLRRIAMIPPELDGAICSTAFSVIRPKMGRATAPFLFQTVQTSRFIAELARRQAGANYPAVSDSAVMSQCIALPKLREQKEIASILSTVDRKILVETDFKNRLDELKTGVMQNLLTGKVRFPQFFVGGPS